LTENTVAVELETETVIIYQARLHVIHPKTEDRIVKELTQTICTTIVSIVNDNLQIIGIEE